MSTVFFSASPTQPDTDPQKDGQVALRCSLWRYTDLLPCPKNSVRWLDETGTVLLGEGVGYRFEGQMNCDSFLTVMRESGRNRTFR